MGHKKYMSVGDVEVPYEHPPQDSPKSTFSIDFMLFLIKHVARSKSQVILSK